MLYRYCDFPSHLYGKLELLALEDLGVVHVEEIAVQNRLNDTSRDGNVVHLVVGLGKVSVDPVGNVKGTVSTEGEEVVGGDGLGLASSLQHEELGKNGNRLKPDGKGPKDFGEGVLVGEDDGQEGSSGEEILDSERINVGVVGWLVCVRHQVDDVTL